MSYFISKEIETNIKNNFQNLKNESEHLNNSLTKHEKALNNFKKYFFFNIMKSYCQKLKRTIAQEEVLQQNMNYKINLYQEITAKIKSLVTTLYSIGEGKSIFNEETYYECLNLYQKLTIDLTSLSKPQLEITNLEEINNFLEEIYTFYGSVNFNKPNFDYHTPIEIEDYDLLFEISNLIDLICYCFKYHLSYEEFILKVKKYLTLSELTNPRIRARKVFKNKLNA